MQHQVTYKLGLRGEQASFVQHQSENLGLESEGHFIRLAIKFLQSELEKPSRKSEKILAGLLQELYLEGVGAMRPLTGNRRQRPA